MAKPSPRSSPRSRRRAASASPPRKRAAGGRAQPAASPKRRRAGGAGEAAAPAASVRLCAVAEGDDAYLCAWRDAEGALPGDAARQADPAASAARREELRRAVQARAAPLRERFGRAVPNANAAALLRALGPLVHAGGPSSAHWAAQADAVVVEGGAEGLAAHAGRVLLLCAPGVDGTPTAAECLRHYTGRLVAVVDEPFGSSAHGPLGAANDVESALALAADAHVLARLSLPNWPGEEYCLTLYARSARLDEGGPRGVRYVPRDERATGAFLSPFAVRLLRGDAAAADANADAAALPPLVWDAASPADALKAARKARDASAAPDGALRDATARYREAPPELLFRVADAWVALLLWRREGKNAGAPPPGAVALGRFARANAARVSAGAVGALGALEALLATELDAAWASVLAERAQEPGWLPPSADGRDGGDTASDLLLLVAAARLAAGADPALVARLGEAARPGFAADLEAWRAAPGRAAALAAPLSAAEVGRRFALLRGGA